MSKMNPILKEVRSLIKEISSLDKKDNQQTFPIAIIGGIYTKPNGGFFKHKCMWSFIQKTDIGYLTTHKRMTESGMGGMGYCGCPLSNFDDSVKIKVRDILKNALDQMKGREE